MFQVKFLYFKPHLVILDLLISHTTLFYTMQPEFNRDTLTDARRLLRTFDYCSSAFFGEATSKLLQEDDNGIIVTVYKFIFKCHIKFILPKKCT